MPNTDRSTRTADSGAECRGAESHPLSRAFCSNTVEYGVSNSSLEFERLRKQVKEWRSRMHVRSLQDTGALHRHEQPEGATDCRSFTAMVQEAEQVWQSRHTSGRRTLSSHNDMCQRFEGYRSQYSDKEKRRERSDQNTVKGAQWKDRCRGFRRYS